MDEAARRTTLSARARELKGRGGASATIESTLEPAGAGTKVTIVTDLTLQGAVAQYGRGVVADVSNQLVKRFAECIAAQLQDAPAAAAAEAEDAVGAPSPPAAAPAPQPTPVQPLGGLGLVVKALLRPLLRVVGRS
jgi:hypothetical protein